MVPPVPVRAPAPVPTFPSPESYPVGPSVEKWRAMSPEARERFLEEVNTAFSDPNLLMTEGRPHKRAKSRAADMLDLHFKRSGRVIYVAEEMSVVYPEQPSFAPDVLAVLDVAQPEDDLRMSWVVADEGKGLDFVLEVLDRGDRRKDLTYNVDRYARLGIPEYFVYDRASQRVLGYRLPAPEARKYERIVPQGGRYASSVLGLDLAIEDGSLRFFHGMAELFGSDDLIRRLTGMVDSLEAKAAEAEARANEANTRAAEEAAKANEANTRAAEAAAKVNEALGGLRTSVLAALQARGLAVDEESREQVMACEDPATLQRWLIRAITAGSAAEALAN